MSVVNVKCICRSTNIVFRPSTGRGNGMASSSSFRLRTACTFLPTVWYLTSCCTLTANSLFIDKKDTEQPRPLFFLVFQHLHWICQNKLLCFPLQTQYWVCNKHWTMATFCEFQMGHFKINNHPYIRSANKPWLVALLATITPMTMIY